MSQAYQMVFQCPNGHSVNLQRRYTKGSLSESEAGKIFGKEQISCSHPDCGWRGKASKARLLRVLPFNWVLSPATT
jgi:hypothetical protein